MLESFFARGYTVYNIIKFHKICIRSCKSAFYLYFYDRNVSVYHTAYSEIICMHTQNKYALSNYYHCCYYYYYYLQVYILNLYSTGILLTLYILTNKFNIFFLYSYLWAVIFVFVLPL